jgi:hypothetical protein
MPELPPPDRVRAALLTLLMLGLLVAVVVLSPPVGLVLLTLFACTWILAHCTSGEPQPRTNATICHFARAFERRTVDTWILRATYEILSAAGKPIRADDRLCDLLDADDLDFEVLDVADRCGRSLEQPDANPFYGSITTVRDLVLFLNHQPMLAATRAFRGMHG